MLLFGEQNSTLTGFSFLHSLTAWKYLWAAQSALKNLFIPSFSLRIYYNFINIIVNCIPFLLSQTTNKPRDRLQLGVRRGKHKVNWSSPYRSALKLARRKSSTQPMQRANLFATNILNPNAQVCTSVPITIPEQPPELCRPIWKWIPH